MHTHNSFGAAFQGICLHLNDPSEQRKGQRALWAAVFFVMRSCIQYIGQILLTVHLGLHIIIVRQSVAPLSFCQFSFLTDCFFYAREAGDTHRSPCASVAVQSLPPSRTSRATSLVRGRRGEDDILSLRHGRAVPPPSSEGGRDTHRPPCASVAVQSLPPSRTPHPPHSLRMYTKQISIFSLA